MDKRFNYFAKERKNRKKHTVKIGGLVFVCDDKKQADFFRELLKEYKNESK